MSDCFDYYKICKGLIRFEMSRPKIAFAYFGVIEKSLKLNWYSSSCFAINCFILASLIYFPRKKKFFILRNCYFWSDTFDFMVAFSGNIKACKGSRRS